ncbi:MAG: iron dependent repressor, metal binding and dimerization domain protein [Candidatus Micrarchaeota archaeon]
MCCKKIGKKHGAIKHFLEKCLCVGKERACREACAIEHHLSDDTVKKMVKLCKCKKCF